MERRAPPPTWLNQQFLENVLEKKKDKRIIVDTMDVTYASVQGLGYASFMYRVLVSFKEDSSKEIKKESVVVKVGLDSGALKELVDKLRAFRTESLFLYEVMPQIHESLISVEGDEFSPLTAECYYCGEEPQEFLVLEDLAVAGFRTADAGKPLDYHHCRLVMRAYARLHASSVHFLTKCPEYKDKFTTSAFSEKMFLEYFQTMGEKIFIAIADELGKCAGYEQYSEKYRKMVNGFVASAISVLEKEKGKTQLPVLVHGDCWKNNLMFKYLDEEVTGVRLVDLQVTNVNSPASDLQYFLFANASEEIHRHHLDSLLEEYHGTLQTTLRRLGLELEAEAYSFEELQRDMDRYAPVGVLFSAFSALFLTSEKYGAEFTEALNNPEKFGDAAEKMLRNPYSLSYMKYLSPVFDSKGLLISA